MMGVYIKGMEMPTGNDSIALFIYSDGVVVEYEMFGPLGRYTAVPVPPHGDLIDRDALCDGLVSNHPVVIHANAAPTIIPADPPKEEA